MGIKTYRKLHLKVDESEKELGERFYVSPSYGFHKKDSPKTQKMKFFPWMLPIPFDKQDFASGKYNQKLRLLSGPNLKGVVKATTLVSLYAHNKNNIMSHNQLISNFVVVDEHY